MNIPNCSKTPYPTYNHKIENKSSRNNQLNQNSAKYVTDPGKLYQITDIPKSNGVTFPNKSVTSDSHSAFKNSNNISLPPPSKPNKGFLICTSYEKTASSNNESLLNCDQSRNTVQYIEREMPNLIRESETDQRSSLLTDSTSFNQRYQNIRQFPNYRNRKKVAFERKLKRCGLELDGELTISILRQFLQPFIYRDINSILDEYIKKYFMKAFENIRENINITSENWSQIIKCSISKSLYKQFCTNATIDPFDPISADLTDFPCFPNLCKVSNPSNQKNNTVLSADVVVKTDIYDSAVPDIASDNNSDFSTCSDHYDIKQIDIDPPTNRCCHKLNLFPYPDQEIAKNQSNNLFRKRHIETNKMLHLKLPNFNGSNDCDESSHKFPKKLHSTQPINHCRVPNLLGQSNDLPSTIHSQLHPHNNYQSLPNNLAKISYDQIDPRTAPFENKNNSFFKDPSLNLSIMRNPSQSAIQPDNYLNLSHNSIENNDSNNRYFQST